MASQWYYSVNGKVSGPYSEERFFEVFHGAGSPGKEALVRKEAEGPEQWISASEVEGLLQVRVKKSLLPASVREAQAAPPPPVSVYLQPPAEEKPRSRLPLIFLGVVAALALIAGGLVAAHRYLDKKKPATTVQPPPAKPAPAKPTPPPAKPTKPAPSKPVTKPTAPAKPQPAKSTPTKPTAKPPAKPATPAKPQPAPAKTTTPPAKS